MVLGATALWGINGSFAKAALSSGLSSLRLTEVRSTGAALVLVGALAIARPRSLRIRRGELPFLLLFGVAGLAFVQLLYFVAIHRLEIGIALLIQYVAPVLIALWARLVLGAGQTAGLGGADPRARRALVRRRPLERRRARRARSPGGAGVGSRVRPLHPPGGKRRHPTRSGLAARAGLHLRRPLLGRRSTVVVVPDGVSGRPGQPRRRRLLHHAAGLGAPDRRRPRRHDRAVPPAPRSASPPLCDPGRRDRDVRAGCGRTRRLCAARGVAHGGAARGRCDRPRGHFARPNGALTVNFRAVNRSVTRGNY